MKRSRFQLLSIFRPQTIHPTFLCFSSLYWLSGFSSLMQSLSNNIKRVVTRRAFRPLLLVHLIEQYKVNVLVTPPSQIAMLVQAPILKLADLSSIRMHIVVGGFIDESLRTLMQEHILYGALLVTYGMTEVASMICLTEPFRKLSNSSGFITPNFKIKVN